jgi:hypothetical protein
MKTIELFREKRLTIYRICYTLYGKFGVFRQRVKSINDDEKLRETTGSNPESYTILHGPVRVASAW